MEYKVTNIVAKLKTSPVDLDDLFIFLTVEQKACKLTSSFPAVFVKLNNGTCTFFRTGTVTLNGCKSEAEVERLYSEIKGLGYPGTFSEPVIVNVVCQFSLNTNVSLEKLYRSLDCIYEPELSNSLHIRLADSIIIMLHGTGNGIVTGLKCMKSLKSAMEFLRAIVFLKHSNNLQT